jgi:hypothetical protein
MIVGGGRSGREGREDGAASMAYSGIEADRSRTTSHAVAYEILNSESKIVCEK